MLTPPHTLKRSRLALLAAACLSAMILVGCDQVDVMLGDLFATPEPSPTPFSVDDTMPILNAEQTATPSQSGGTPAATPEETNGQFTLTVWMPETLAPNGETEGGQELQSQITAFDEARTDLDVDVEVKLTTGAGSTLSYLHTAPEVAPSILPDVALVNLNALVQAAHDELVVPVNTMVTPEETSRLYPAAVELSTIDGILIGIPYVLEMQHTVYREVLFLEPPNSFAAVLESPVPFVFPAGTLGEAGRVNRTTMAEYLEAAGGSLLNDAGEPYIDEDALSEVLQFYVDAEDESIIEPALLQLTNPTETWQMFSARQAGLATVRSTDYLAARDTLTGTQFTWIPTASGEPFTLVDGWMWVITTRDPNRQQAAMSLVNFLMDPINHGSFTEAAGWLPSQPEALNVWTQTDQYASFADQVLANAAPVPEAGLQATVGVAIQDALESVLLDGVSPVQAAVDAAQRVNQPQGGG